MSTVLFGLGQLVATPGALDDLNANGKTAAQLIERHIVGDFGDVSEADAEANRQDIAAGSGRVRRAAVCGTLRHGVPGRPAAVPRCPRAGFGLRRGARFL